MDLDCTWGRSNNYCYGSEPGDQEAKMKVANRDILGRFVKGSRASPSTEFRKGNVSWIKGKHQSDEAKQKCRIASKGNHYRLIHPDLEMSENLAYILGVIYGDGYFRFLKGSWIVGLHVTKMEFVKSFENALRQIRLRPHRTTSLEFTRVGNQCYRVIAYSKALHDFFEKLTFSKLRDILVAKECYIWAFLRGLYESEGTKFYRGKHSLMVVVLYNTNRKLIQFSEGLLNHLGLFSSIGIRKPYGNRKSLYRLALRGSSQRKEEFLRLLNPCIKRAQEQKIAVMV